MFVVCVCVCVCACRPLSQFLKRYLCKADYGLRESLEAEGRRSCVALLAHLEAQDRAEDADLISALVGLPGKEGVVDGGSGGVGGGKGGAGKARTGLLLGSPCLEARMLAVQLLGLLLKSTATR